MITLDARDKPLAGGYLLETPNPWVFGPGRRYFVTEEQKSALLVLGAFQRPPTALRIALVTAIILVIACGTVLLAWKLSVGIGAAFFAMPYVVMLVRIRRFLRRIAPIVADAVETTERERSVVSTGAIPTKIVVFCMVLWSLTAVGSAVLLAYDAARGTISFFPAFDFVLAVGLLLSHAWILRKRRHQVKA